MEIARIQQNDPNTNFMAKIEYNPMIKNLKHYISNGHLPLENKSIGNSNDTVYFSLSEAVPKGNLPGFKRILSVTANLFNGNKINWNSEIWSESKTLYHDETYKIFTRIKWYIQSLEDTSNKFKKEKAEKLADIPFAKFSVTDTSRWGYISGGKSYDSLNMMHFIADFANRAEKEIENGTDVSVAKSIALEQLKKENKYDFGAIDFSTANKVLESVWKYGKLI